MKLFSLLKQHGIPEKIILAFRSLPRERFLASAEVYADKAQPIGSGQTISQPSLVALMIDELALTGSERVLEVGSGSGYVVALLSLLCKEVLGLERVPELLKRSQRTLHGLGKEGVLRNNYSLKKAGAVLGLPGETFDRIIVSAAAPSMPEDLLKQLAVGGVMIIPVGVGSQWLWRVEKTATGLREEKLLPVRFVPLL